LALLSKQELLWSSTLNDAMQQLVLLKGNSRETITNEDLREYVIHGAAKRLRPKIMTVCNPVRWFFILWSIKGRQ
jgi:Cu(I)/Ag(I) efflux system membrane protein CusA/SilA